ncbi:MAG: imidazole glycerol phosphate synthase subunit HisH [Bacteroidales bacterium]
MKVAIIKYNAGNIMSVDYALQRLGIQPLVTNVPEEITSADRVIFPGVGEASTTMGYLKKEKLDLLIRGLKQPVLGICLGMQLMCLHSEENNTPCIGIFKEKVIKFLPKPGNENVHKVPQMGWNSLYNLKGELFKNIPGDSFVYFVHSYYASTGNDTAAFCDYIVPFSAALQKENFYATQFHPEKSGKTGAVILENFLKIKK